MTGCGVAGHHGQVDVDSFVSDGFVAVRQAVDRGTAAACRELVWQSMARRGLRRSDPATWPPLVRIDDLDAGPFVVAGLSPALVAAYDELIGPGRWTSPVAVGRALMVRFPSQDHAGAGYHIEASYPGLGGQGWRANVSSRARGLLALFLLSDVGPDDAPTRLVCGSHLTVARFLAPYGEAGADTDADQWYPSTLSRPVAHATGAAGDVFLCHPFIVHTATWPHRRTGPRMIAQPAVSAPAVSPWTAPTVAPVPIPLGW